MNMVGTGQGVLGCKVYPVTGEFGIAWDGWLEFVV